MAGSFLTVQVDYAQVWQAGLNGQTFRVSDGLDMSAFQFDIGLAEGATVVDTAARLVRFGYDPTPVPRTWPAR